MGENNMKKQPKKYKSHRITAKWGSGKLHYYTSTWTAVDDPLYHIQCPHCKSDIFMSTPSLMEKLKRWAKKLIKV